MMSKAYSSDLTDDGWLIHEQFIKQNSKVKFDYAVLMTCAYPLQRVREEEKNDLMTTRLFVLDLLAEHQLHRYEIRTWLEKSGLISGRMFSPTSALKLLTCPAERSRILTRGKGLCGYSLHAAAWISAYLL